MSFDFQNFLDTQNIEYVEHGPNVKVGNIYINCPLCGDDPSHHMGINKTTGAWGCWRAQDHAGYKPYKLVMALLKCSYIQARIVVDQFSVPDPGDLESTLKALESKLEDKKDIKEFETLKFPKEFKKITNKGTTARFHYYLEERGFDDVDDLVYEYNLKCATFGPFKDRIIIPVYEGEELVTWTSRAIINPIGAPRYKDLSEHETEGQSALVNIKDTLFNYDELIEEGGKVLFINEGPLDAMKIDYYGKPMRVRATNIWTSSISIDQIGLLATLKERFKYKYLLLDQNTLAQAMEMVELLRPYGVELIQMPHGFKDPGEFMPRHAKAFCKQYVDM